MQQAARGMVSTSMHAFRGHSVAPQASSRSTTRIPLAAPLTTTLGQHGWPLAVASCNASSHCCHVWYAGNLLLTPYRPTLNIGNDSAVLCFPFSAHVPAGGGCFASGLLRAWRLWTCLLEQGQWCCRRCMSSKRRPLALLPSEGSRCSSSNCCDQQNTQIGATSAQQWFSYCSASQAHQHDFMQQDTSQAVLLLVSHTLAPLPNSPCCCTAIMQARVSPIHRTTACMLPCSKMQMHFSSTNCCAIPILHTVYHSVIPPKAAQRCSWVFSTSRAACCPLLPAVPNAAAVPKQI
jgi:hypothetical protein